MRLQNNYFNSCPDGDQPQRLPLSKELTLLSSTRQMTGTHKIQRLRELLSEEIVAPASK
ncbi:hypothetical protein M758_6G132700 [Ceratodon purpureus]|nr:hypothetical protein M758_6G132700 [Ceratodon purpureus]